MALNTHTLITAVDQKNTHALMPIYKYTKTHTDALASLMVDAGV